LWHDPRTVQTAEDDKKLAAQLSHFKQLRKMAGMLWFLHHSGCGRDKAANRELHFDDYVLLVLLWMFNPMIDSLRTLLRVAALPEVQKKLGVKRCSLGSFSESCRVFDLAMLKRVVEQLAGELLPVGCQELFKGLAGIITLVDGTAPADPAQRRGGDVAAGNRWQGRPKTGCGKNWASIDRAFAARSVHGRCCAEPAAACSIQLTGTAAPPAYSSPARASLRLCRTGLGLSRFLPLRSCEMAVARNHVICGEKAGNIKFLTFLYLRSKLKVVKGS
jgi:hypothetical protein